MIKLQGVVTCVMANPRELHKVDVTAVFQTDPTQARNFYVSEMVELKPLEYEIPPSPNWQRWNDLCALLDKRAITVEIRNSSGNRVIVTTSKALETYVVRLNGNASHAGY